MRNLRLLLMLAVLGACAAPTAPDARDPGPRDAAPWIPEVDAWDR